jgi:predicted esterase
MKLRVTIVCLVLAAAAAARVFASGPGPASVFPPGESIHRLKLHGVGPDHINFLLYVPRAYYLSPEAGFPLIMFLHGTDQRGDNPELLKSVAAFTIVDVEGTLPFIAVFPQCPSNAHWSPGALMAMLDSIEASLRIDRDRVYLTGFSLGGFGVWQTAAAFPDVFAAIAPVCGMSDISDVPRLRDIPVWAFHGALDQNVPLEESEKMAAALRSIGGNVRLTVYPDFAHECWSITYHDSRLYLWFLSQRRGGIQQGAEDSRASLVTSPGQSIYPTAPASALDEPVGAEALQGPGHLGCVLRGPAGQPEVIPHDQPVG